MRLLKICVVAMLVAGLSVPTTAGATTAKLKTKLVFVESPGEGFGPYWDLSTTSVRAPVAKARLLYYRASTRSWVGYARQPIVIKRGYYPFPTLPVTKRTTDANGYFTFTMTFQDKYVATYSGGPGSSGSSSSASRYDQVRVATTTTVTTSSVDAKSTRISMATDYQYNPYFSNEVGVVYWVQLQDDAEEGPEVFSATIANLVKPLNGSAHAETTFVVPSASLAGRHIAVYTLVEYPGRALYWTVDDNEGPTYP